MSQQLCSHLWHFKTSQYQNKQKKKTKRKRAVCAGSTLQCVNGLIYVFNSPVAPDGHSGTGVSLFHFEQTELMFT